MYTHEKTPPLLKLEASHHQKPHMSPTLSQSWQKRKHKRKGEQVFRNCYKEGMLSSSFLSGNEATLCNNFFFFLFFFSVSLIYSCFEKKGPQSPFKLRFYCLFFPSYLKGNGLLEVFCCVNAFHKKATVIF